METVHRIPKRHNYMVQATAVAYKIPLASTYADVEAYLFAHAADRSTLQRQRMARRIWDILVDLKVAEWPGK